MLGKTAEAREEYLQAVAINPEDPEPVDFLPWISSPETLK